LALEAVLAREWPAMLAMRMVQCRLLHQAAAVAAAGTPTDRPVSLAVLAETRRAVLAPTVSVSQAVLAEQPHQQQVGPEPHRPPFRQDSSQVGQAAAAAAAQTQQPHQRAVPVQHQAAAAVVAAAATMRTREQAQQAHAAQLSSSAGKGLSC
jgi:hypothetical protein